MFLILVVAALYNGYRYGFIRAFFSVIGLMIGLAAAMKLSVVATHYMQDATMIPARWVPFVSFGLVFAAVMFIIRIIAGLLQKAAKLAMLGWANKLAGIVLYLGIYIIAFSVVLFYADKIHLLKAGAISSSKTYPYLQPCGPAVINALGFVVPYFKNMFHELEVFFGKIGG